MTIEQGSQKELIISPLGPQGPKIGLQINSEEDIVRLDEAMGELSERERKTTEGILSAARKANVPVIDL